ncbi:MAG: Gfo/Idh/MocA family oxidoreductase [Anaerolineae bacterium]|nr:Gfo/Idh/MocA family oxidoreductase [Anaerolineae bacterium]
MERLRVAVLGMGVMGNMHAQVYRHLAESDLVAAVETDPTRQVQVREQFGVPVYGTVEELLGGVDFDAASICLPDAGHVEPAVALAGAGKHLLVEKPLATTIQGCDAIIRAAGDAGVKLMVGFTLRFDPRYYLVQEAVAQGEVGDVVYMYARRNNLISGARRLAGRVTLPFFLQVHDVDAMRWMGGSEVRRVYACSTRKVLHDLGVDDVVISSLHFEDGSIGCVESNWIMPDALPSRFDFRLEVVGTKGKADVELYEQGAWVHDGKQLRMLDPTFRPTLYSQQPLILREELQHFVHCVLEDRQPVVGGKDGKAATAVALAIEESIRQGQPVDVEYS